MTSAARCFLTVLSALMILGWSSIADAQFMRGYDLFRTGQYCEAREAWLESEKSGDSTSPFGLAELYAQGLCVKKNDRLASRWYLTAAQRGNPRARAEIGMRYAYGKGVNPDVVKAYVWISTSRASAGGWERDFVSTVDKNVLIVERMMTAVQRQRATDILEEFNKTYRLPREFDSLD